MNYETRNRIADGLVDVIAKVTFAALMTAFGAYLISHYLGNLRRSHEPPKPYGHELIAKLESRPGDLEKIVQEK